MMDSAAIQELLDKFEITASDLSLVRAASALLEEQLDSHIDDFYKWMSAHKEYKVFFASDLHRLERVKTLQRTHWMTMFEARIDERWIASRKHIGAVHANIDLPHDIYFAGMAVSGKSLVDRLTNQGQGLEKPAQTASALTKLVFLDAYVVIEEIARLQREKIESSAKALQEMSTPVMPIWDEILLLPLVGVLDSERSDDVMRKSLDRISETRSKVFILDISGVPVVDTAVANQLLKITRATLLLGCETIISGLSPAIARTMVELGVDVGEVRTTSTLRDSFMMAWRKVGVDPKLMGERSRA